ncbi:MAG: cupin domain-containing protein, partial [Balneolaceae bacterium]|nr:cupin domain-containing protein [Balneolaceae bacterium]
MSLKILFSTFLISIVFSFTFIEQTAAQTTAEQPVTSTKILQATSTWNGGEIEYPLTESAEITVLHIEFATGSETVWHRHPVPSLAYILSGELEVTIKNGETKIFRKGDAFAEVINTWHYGKNIGKEPVRLVV